MDCVLAHRDSWKRALLGVFAAGEAGDSHTSWMEPNKEAEVVQDDRRERKLSPTLDGIGVCCLLPNRDELGVDLTVGRKLDERSPCGKGEDTLCDALVGIFAAGFTSCCITRLSWASIFSAEWTTAGDPCPMQLAPSMLSGLSTKSKETQLRDFGEAVYRENSTCVVQHSGGCGMYIRTKHCL